MGFISIIKDILGGMMDLKESIQETTGHREVSRKTLELIKEFEGFSPKAYPDVANVWTIGYGSTFYKDGTKVKQGDTITRSEAELLLKHVVDDFATKVNKVVKVELNDCQFGAIVSLAYNIGTKGFSKSTLLRKLNKNPNDITIENEFLRWVRAGGRLTRGLVNRRKKESDFYFSKDCN